MVLVKIVLKSSLMKRAGAEQQRPITRKRKRKRFRQIRRFISDNPNNDNGKKHAHDNLHNGKGVEGSSHDRCDDPVVACPVPK